MSGFIIAVAKVLHNQRDMSHISSRKLTSLMSDPMSHLTFVLRFRFHVHLNFEGEKEIRFYKCFKILSILPQSLIFQIFEFLRQNS